VLREVAEYPNSFTPLGPKDERIETGRFTLCMGRGSYHSTVQRQRFRTDEVDAVLEEVRALLRARGRTRTQWEIGSAATPRELAHLLLQRGLAWDDDPIATAVVLSREPPAPPPGVIARRAETFDEYAAARAVQWEAFDAPPAQIAEVRASLETSWAEMRSTMHVVWIDGEIVCAGTCSPTQQGLALHGGATVPRARGRGAYRALIHVRWQEAVRLGTPVLLTQAGAMSRPILERLGFDAVGRVEMLVDEFGPATER
jgi:hypothetical protein